jgi:hypothetical protein
MNISHLSNFKYELLDGKKMQIGTYLVKCNMNCGKMYVVDPTIVVFLTIFIQKLKLPFMFKDKPFISYSFSIIAHYP